MVAFCLELDEREEQVVDHCRPDLSHDGVLGGSQKRFDRQVLLDPFEEGLDLPPRLVQVSDGAGGKREVIWL